MADETEYNIIENEVEPGRPDKPPKPKPEKPKPKAQSGKESPIQKFIRQTSEGSINGIKGVEIKNFKGNQVTVVLNGKDRKINYLEAYRRYVK